MEYITKKCKQAVHGELQLWNLPCSILLPSLHHNFQTSPHEDPDLKVSCHLRWIHHPQVAEGSPKLASQGLARPPLPQQLNAVPARLAGSCLPTHLRMLLLPAPLQLPVIDLRRCARRLLPLVPGGCGWCDPGGR